MKYIIIRDDDINYFTSPDDISKIYGFLFEKGASLNFSIIPCINTSARSAREALTDDGFEPFLPEDVRGGDEDYPITLNQRLIRWLNELKNIEFLMHGFTHRGTDEKFEFEAGGIKTIEAKIAKGMDIFNAAFKIRPRTFVAPEDKYSKAALKVIMDRFEIFSTGWIDKTKIPKRFLFDYYQMKLRRGNFLKQGKFLMAEHPGVLFSRFKKESDQKQKLDSYLKGHEVTVIVVHHWEFLKNGQLLKDLYDRFKELMLSLLEDRDYKFIRFSELYDIKIKH